MSSVLCIDIQTNEGLHLNESLSGCSKSILSSLKNLSDSMSFNDNIIKKVKSNIYDFSIDELDNTGLELKFNQFTEKLYRQMLAAPGVAIGTATGTAVGQTVGSAVESWGGEK